MAWGRWFAYLGRMFVGLEMKVGWEFADPVIATKQEFFTCYGRLKLIGMLCGWSGFTWNTFEEVPSGVLDHRRVLLGLGGVSYGFDTLPWICSDTNWVMGSPWIFFSIHGWGIHPFFFGWGTGSGKIWVVTCPIKWALHGGTAMVSSDTNNTRNAWFVAGDTRYSNWWRRRLHHLDSTEDKFSLRSAWDAIYPRYPSVPWASFVWHMGAIPRHAFYAWRSLIQGLPTHDALQRQGFIFASRCSLCMEDIETTDHIMWTCPFSCRVWAMLLPQMCRQNQAVSSLMEVTNSIIFHLQQQRTTMCIQWCIACTFCTVISGLWMEWNHRLSVAKHKAKPPHILCNEIGSVQVGPEDVSAAAWIPM